MLKFVTITLAAAVALVSTEAQADMTQGGIYRDITALNHPMARSLVAVNQMDNTKSHFGNGVVYGPGGCFVVTNFHVAFAKSKNADGSMNWVHPSRGEFLRNAIGHTLDIRADLDPSTGVFRRNLVGKVIGHGNFNRVHGRGELGRDLAILQLFDAKTNQPACLGEDLRATTQEYNALRDGLLKDVNTIHVFKTGENTARVYANSQPCQTIASLAAGGVQADCRLRDGASGSLLLVQNGNGTPMIGLAANEATVNGSFYAMGAVAVDQINRVMRKALEEQQALAPHVIADFFNSVGDQASAGTSTSTVLVR